MQNNLFVSNIFSFVHFCLKIENYRNGLGLESEHEYNNVFYCSKKDKTWKITSALKCEG